MMVRVMAISEREVVYVVEWKIFEGELEGMPCCLLLLSFYLLSLGSTEVVANWVVGNNTIAAKRVRGGRRPLD